MYSKPMSLLRLPVSLMPHAFIPVAYSWKLMTGTEHPVVKSGSSMYQVKDGGVGTYEANI